MAQSSLFCYVCVFFCLFGVFLKKNNTHIQLACSPSAYLVDENIQRRVYGASLAAGHRDKSEAHSDVEPLAVARSRQDLGPSPLLLFGGPGGVLAAFSRPSLGGGNTRGWWREKDVSEGGCMSLELRHLHGGRWLLALYGRVCEWVRKATRSSAAKPPLNTQNTGRVKFMARRKFHLSQPQPQQLLLLQLQLLRLLRA